MAACDKIILQRYEEDWINNYEDINDDAKVADCKKLKVIILPTLVDSSIAGPFTDTSREPEVNDS